jgi:hypothetical protein
MAAIPENLRHYWWRGYFDGDGWFTISKNAGVAGICSCSGQDWMFFQNLVDKLEFTIFQQDEVKESGRVSKMLLVNRPAIFKFFNYIYKGESFGLQRKKDKFLDFTRRYEEMRSKRVNKYIGVTNNNGRYCIAIMNNGVYTRESYDSNAFSEEYVAKRYDELVKKIKGNKALTNF